MKPKLEEAKQYKRKVYFVDASHFVWGAFIGCLWCFARLFMPTPSGRKRYNVLGAIDAISHELITVCNDTYINAVCICELLIRIRFLHNLIPITLVLDNARYQRCQLVMEMAEKLNIELLFLPSYSPNLNLIERLWKWIKKDCLYCKYYDCFDKFKQQIDCSLQKVISPACKKDMDTLLNLKFQSFLNTQIMTG